MRGVSLLVCSLLFAVCSLARAQTHIEIVTPMSPPDWALLERELLRANLAAVEEFFATYNDERGYLLHTPRWGTLDGTDDAIETYANWTLLHMLGASDSVLELFKKALEGHLLQYKELKTEKTDIAKDGAYYKEFMPMSDWHHNGEGMQGFMNQGLSDPADVRFQTRMRRFAGFYMNEDPQAPNYDPEQKIIRSIWNGSKGPMLRRATRYDWVGDPFRGRFHIVHSAAGRREMLDAEETYPEMLAHCAEYLHSAGDHPLNLLATQLALNAYALSNEEKYKNWLLEYVDAWKERVEKNGGNIPSNIGLDGSIGGETDGNWFGGTYGWDFSPWSPEHQVVAHRNMFAKGMWPGFGNALMVSGDQAYVDVLRRQMDNIYAQKKIVEGKVMVPHNYGVKSPKTGPPIFKMVNGELTWKERKTGNPGWYNWTTDLFVPELIDIYMWSMDRKDLERIPMTGWITFLEGKNPDYPQQALRAELSFIRRRIEGMRSDPTTPDTRLADWAMGFNPAATHELAKLMLGGYLHGRIWVAHTRLRYFDPVENRAGVPADVAALVTEMNDEMVRLTLVNVNQVEARDLIVQTGAYGEHQCLRVEIGRKRIPVNHRFFHVRLAPGAGAALTIYMRRYINPPALAFPWHGDHVPSP
ncbi:hypothetical protein MYX78_07855 [Acidobacteria bacterium AH-259-G07]|nr:hypothetical protein [Acidobacteria bacterium AH-259-G07]